MFQALSWFAVVLLSVSYWFQIWKIHVHREVRDLSLLNYFFLALGFGILGVTAYFEGSVVFLVKQVLTTIPVLVIIGQIFYHQQDHWHDENLPVCASCEEEIELDWVCCPYCACREKKEQK